MLLERDEHEQEECLERDVPCTWVDIKNNNTRCMAVVKAKELRDHRKEHLATLGVMRYRTPGSHVFTVRRQRRILDTVDYSADLSRCFDALSLDVSMF